MANRSQKNQLLNAHGTLTPPYKSCMSASVQEMPGDAKVKIVQEDCPTNVDLGVQESCDYFHERNISQPKAAHMAGMRQSAGTIFLSSGNISPAWLL